MDRPRRRLPLLVATAAVVALVGSSGVAAQTPEQPATTLRVTIDRLLAEHALLSMDVIRSAMIGGPDFDAAAALLDANTAEVIGAIEGVYGPEAGAAFGDQWRNHIGYLVDYARARVSGDADAAGLAQRQLDRYVAEFSALLAEAMPVLPKRTVRGLISEHVQQLEHVADFDEGHFGQAYPAIRHTHHHMFDIGDGLVVGIINGFPDRFPGREQAFSAATDLRIAMDRLFGEHTHLAALAMRATIDDAPDVASAASAVEQNSAEIAGVIGDLYGQQAGEAFASLWNSHVSSYLAYVDASAAADESAVETALAGLSDYHRDFSAFVAGANPFLSASDVEALISTHTDHLVGQADAYAAGDYETAHRLAHEAYVHTGTLSASLAAAIGEQFPQRFPDTGTAGLTVAGSEFVSVALAIALALAGIGVAHWRRARAGADAFSE
jgi:hypothetical protein